VIIIDKLWSVRAATAQSVAGVSAPFQKRLVGQDWWRILSRSEELTHQLTQAILVGVEGVDDQRQQLIPPEGAAASCLKAVYLSRAGQRFCARRRHCGTTSVSCGLYAAQRRADAEFFWPSPASHHCTEYESTDLLVTHFDLWSRLREKTRKSEGAWPRLIDSSQIVRPMAVCTLLSCIRLQGFGNRGSAL
jgi:hypothetical protein